MEGHPCFPTGSEVRADLLVAILQGVRQMNDQRMGLRQRYQQMKQEAPDSLRSSSYSPTFF